MAHILEGKPKIDYPCTWQYKVILEKGVDAKELFSKILTDINYDFKPSNESKGKKYLSFFLSCKVASEKERLDIFDILKKHSSYVL